MGSGLLVSNMLWYGFLKLWVPRIRALTIHFLLLFCPKAELSMDTKNVGMKNPEKKAKAAYVTPSSSYNEHMNAVYTYSTQTVFWVYSYAEFQEREITRLREERPGLRLSQYKVKQATWRGIESRGETLSLALITYHLHGD